MTVQRCNTAITAVSDRTPPVDVHALPVPPAWMVDAVCAQVDLDLWFPEKGGTAAPAKAVCAGCPVRLPCLDYALAFESGDNGTPTSHIFVGVYGGLSAQERRRILRTRQQQHRQEPA